MVRWLAALCVLAALLGGARQARAATPHDTASLSQPPASALALPKSLVGDLLIGMQYESFLQGYDSSTGGISYQWHVQTNHVGGVGPSGYYQAMIFTSLGLARTYNARQKRLAYLGEGNGCCLKPVAPKSPAPPAEWLYAGSTFGGHCAYIGGFVWNNIVFFDAVFSDKVVASRCRIWADDVLHALARKISTYRPSGITLPASPGFQQFGPVQLCNANDVPIDNMLNNTWRCAQSLREVDRDGSGLPFQKVWLTYSVGHYPSSSYLWRFIGNSWQLQAQLKDDGRLGIVTWTLGAYFYRDVIGDPDRLFFQTDDPPQDCGDRYVIVATKSDVSVLGQFPFTIAC
jgi:hypothetical protein